jgi:nitrogen-specific signal transduction histidine kinase
MVTSDAIKIADDGPGIPQDIQSCIFEPFFLQQKVKGKA